MATQLLARSNGWIEIVEVIKTTKSYLVIKPVFEGTIHKVFIKEQGHVWELFMDVGEAEKWIRSQQK